MDSKRAVELYADMVFRICSARLWHTAKDSIDDAFQNVFLNYIKSEARFADDEHEKAWFVRCAINCCTDVLRERRRHPKVDYDDTLDIAEFLCPSLNTGHEIGLLEAIFRLPEKYRLVILLHYAEGYNTLETAKILKLPHATVRTQLKRGKALLQKTLETEYDMKLGGDCNAAI